MKEFKATRGQVAAVGKILPVTLGSYELKLLNDGRILLVIQNSYRGSEIRVTYGILKLNSDGTLNSNFNSNNDFIGGITGIDVQSGNRIIVGETFDVVSGVLQIGIARLIGDSNTSRPLFILTATVKPMFPSFAPITAVGISNSQTPDLWDYSSARQTTKSFPPITTATAKPMSP